MSGSDDDRGGDGGGFDLDAAPLWVDEPSSSTTKGAPATKKDAKAASKAEKDREAEEARKRSSKACASPSLPSVGRTAAPQRLTSFSRPATAILRHFTRYRRQVRALQFLAPSRPRPPALPGSRQPAHDPGGGATGRGSPLERRSIMADFRSLPRAIASCNQSARPLRSRYASAAARANANVLGFSTRHRRLPSGHARTA